ncbi:hypothetical protein D3C76_842500 [compost metagenome]
MIARQFQRHGGPEQAERGEHAPLVKRSLAQHRLLAQERPERTQQLAVGCAVVRLALGNGHRQHDADRSHQQCSNHEHCPPTEMIGHHAGHRSRQQDPQQQAAHDPADHAAARFFRRQVRGQRNQDLHRHRAEAHQQRNQQEHVRLIGERRAQQTGNRHQGGDDHQPAVFQQVTQGHEEEQAQGVADLGQRHDQAGHGAGQADVRCDQPNDWLRIVDVGDDRTAAEGEQQHHASGHCRGAVGHLGRWGHNVSR